jgi:hypothetical protein
MITIYKFALTNELAQPLSLPKGAEILHVTSQGNMICLWVMLDNEMEVEVREITRIGTGWEIAKDPGRYIGTVTTEARVLCTWHFFERLAK